MADIRYYDVILKPVVPGNIFSTASLIIALLASG